MSEDFPMTSGKYGQIFRGGNSVFSKDVKYLTNNGNKRFSVTSGDEQKRT